MIRAKATALFVVALAVAGLVVAIRAGVGGLAVLFGIIGAISVPLQPDTGRRSVRLRPDLARWLDQVSVSSAESTEDVLDRAVSAYRASMSRSPDG